MSEIIVYAFLIALVLVLPPDTLVRLWAITIGLAFTVGLIRAISRKIRDVIQRRSGDRLHHP